ncbi:uncharacterized protein EV422DRAFT_527727 [Fimicolochytrium jonesii]|uniref:uncharacterized protein n=1 Tax=Fimicolochytrium jonesii TaxID=1396493 RepID=UPI0022FE1B40|nr:uncharacterized protein EV422DRAFT_527727 [Fimicolochytrium jonesii]KAI8821320.1 hypothetical protein EV422DRAFT_527727 [Fimicolochytrium jonesii]
MNFGDDDPFGSNAWADEASTFSPSLATPLAIPSLPVAQSEDEEHPSSPSPPRAVDPPFHQHREQTPEPVTNGFALDVNATDSPFQDDAFVTDVPSTHSLPPPLPPPPKPVLFEPPPPLAPKRPISPQLPTFADPLNLNDFPSFADPVSADLFSSPPPLHSPPAPVIFTPPSIIEDTAFPQPDAFAEPLTLKTGIHQLFADDASMKPFPPSIKSEASDDESVQPLASIKVNPQPKSKTAGVRIIFDPLTSSLVGSSAQDDEDAGGRVRDLKGRIGRLSIRDKIVTPDDDDDDNSPLAETFLQLAPKYTFECHVTDPLKVSQAMGAYVLYRVNTHTTHPRFRNPSMAVNRRFSDFLWLFNQLVAQHPGVIIPPVPEKQTLGRFQEEFVENRRVGLEQFLRKVVRHPYLQENPDLQSFLESETFLADRKKPEQKSFISTVFNAGTRQPDTDASLSHRRARIETFEPQLRLILRALDDWARMQAQLSSASHEFAATFQQLANLDVTKPISKNLTQVAEIHKRITDLQERQARVDVATLGANAEYYVRVVASVGLAFETRRRVWEAWQNGLAAVGRKRREVEKATVQARKDAGAGRVAGLVRELEQVWGWMGFSLFCVGAGTGP